MTMLPVRLLSLRLPVAAVLLLAGADIAFAQQRPEPGSSPVIPDLSRAGTVIAHVGDRAITSGEFLTNYEFGPAFAKRESDSRHRYLRYMIYEKLLALDAEHLRMLETPRAKRSMAELEADLATEELYRHDIAGTISITDAELQRALSLDRRMITVRWLFARDAREMKILQRRLREGESFDTLLRQTRGDSVPESDRSMELSRFRLQMRNPVLSAIVDTLRPGECSLPVHTDDGWYLVMLAGEWENPVVTRSAEEAMREDVHRALVQRRADSLSDRYVDALISPRRPVIIRRSFDILQTWLARSIVTPEVYRRWNMRELTVKKWGPFDDSDITPYEGDSLVSWTSGRLTVGDFVSWYDARSTSLKLRLSSPEAFFTSLEAYVWRMVRDRFLAERAYAGHYERTEPVTTQLAWWRDKIGYELRKESLEDSVRITDADLKKYYAEHSLHFRDSTGSVPPLEQVRDDVKQEYVTSQITALMLHRITALQQQYKVIIDEPALRGLTIDDENNPRSIDVYTVKTHGTLPRPAYPVIDYDWEGWE